MDIQPNNQKYIKQTSNSSNPVVPENPIPETTSPQTIPEPQIPVTVENPISTMTEVPVSETELPPSQPEPEIEETAPVGEYQNEYQDILNQYNTNQETTEMTPESETLPLSNPTTTESDIFPKPSQNNLFKIIFIISLIIFILTATVLAFIYFKNKNNQKSSPIINNQSSTTNNSEPTNSSDTCFVNDKTYQIGESFSATDGCNTCTCKTQNNISCTDKECTSPKTSTGSALQKESTSSAKKTNTSSTSSASTK